MLKYHFCYLKFNQYREMMERLEGNLSSCIDIYVITLYIKEYL